jgi:S1-C subfamily serine protease
MSEPFAQFPVGRYPGGQYVPEPPRRRARTALGLTATAVVAAAVGAGAAVGLSHAASAGGPAASTSAQTMSTAQISAKVDPGLVDVKATLGYQGAYSLGTGIVLTSNGEILTNNHVINGATAVSVTDIGNGKTYTASVAGYDASHDIAVLRLAGASGLATAPLGDSSSVAVGASVVGLGNAGGAGGTPSVAAGTVTALNQSITASDESSGASEQLSGLIQTDAPIQSGDSGGPLVNGQGQVIGVDTAASTGYQFGAGGSGSNGASGGYGSSAQGAAGTAAGSATEGFTIPVNTALSIAEQIEAGQGSATTHIGATAFLGIELPGTQQGQSQGVTISGAQQGTPAATAGLAQGDVITSVAGQPVASATDIQRILVGHRPGDHVSIAWTDLYGQSRTATVTLASGPAA